MLRYLAVIIGMVLLGGCHPLRGFLESEFDLSPDSRLPVWFKAELGNRSRDEVNVVLRYYKPLIDVDDTVLILENKYGVTITTVTGKRKWHPITTKERETCDKLSSIRPSYVIFTTEGKSEIIEHGKVESIFYVSDKRRVQQYPSECNAPNKAPKPTQ